MSKLIVIQPGGYHPFHAGHYALYQSAQKAFPDADIYVAATNDTKTRPFPFEIKEKLAKIAGVKPGQFVQVRSPFQSKEILQNYNPDEDVLIFVRSEKDKNEHPQPGGHKKDGSPAYFQPYTGKNMAPFGKHGYFAYLPTVEFGPGIKSATEIRNSWPKLNNRQKLAMVYSLYPKTQQNQKLAQNVVKMLDLGIGEGLNEFYQSRGEENTCLVYFWGKASQKTIATTGYIIERQGNKVLATFSFGKDSKTRLLPVTSKKYPEGYVDKKETYPKATDVTAGRIWAYIPNNTINEYIQDEPNKTPKQEHPIKVYIHSVLHNMTIKLVGEKLSEPKNGSIKVEFTIPGTNTIVKEWLPIADKEYPTGRLSGKSDGQKPKQYLSDGVFQFWAYDSSLAKKKTNEQDNTMNRSNDRNFRIDFGEILSDLGDGYLLVDDSIEDDERFMKEGFTVIKVADDGKNYRVVGSLDVSPYRRNRKPGEVSRKAKELVAQDKNKNVNESETGVDYVSKKDPSQREILAFAKRHYPDMPDMQSAFVKFVLRSLQHSEEDSDTQEDDIEHLEQKVSDLEQQLKNLTKKVNSKLGESRDYLSEK